MIKANPPEWPTEEDYFNLNLLWRSQGRSAGPYASFGKCANCPDIAYRFGKTYEKMYCFGCFVERNRPKKRRRRAKKTSI